jgi:predicted AAA+ superfamily ATPase
MDWITRNIEKHLDENILPGKVFILFGPRRVGKTTLLQKYVQKNFRNFFIGTGDDIEVRKVLASEDLVRITNSFRGYTGIFIDEAQRIPNIGWGLKLLVDHNPNLKIIASGSSSFQLKNQTGEPLTGRHIPMAMFPVSIGELVENYGQMTVSANLNDYLIYGTYPDVIKANNYNAKQKYLFNLRNSYLFKDILELENLKSPDKLIDLLQLIAFQIGKEVSLNELSRSLGIAKQTVERYLDLLEKSFIIIKVRAYSNNLRKEISKNNRYYFYDNGVRNAVINNFSHVSQRMDTGMLWENFCFIERIKKQAYDGILSNNYFWRTYDKQEIDFIEDRNGILYAYEFKWNANKACKVPKIFSETYPNSVFRSVNPENFWDFVI